MINGTPLRHASPAAFLQNARGGGSISKKINPQQDSSLRLTGFAPRPAIHEHRGGQNDARVDSQHSVNQFSRRILFSAICFLGCLLAGCGYSTRSLLPGSLKTIHIAPFKNKITYTTDSTRNLYLPLLEVKVRNAVADRFLFDGHLRIKDSETADLILKGNLIGYEREVLRYTDNNDVLEYRIRITVSLELWSPKQEKALWSEPSFAGETTYFVAGSQAKSEDTALQDALTDIARRIVERTIEDW